MLDSMYIGATGMQAQQAHVDAIANNLANVNTPAFKKLRVAFSDLVTGAHLSRDMVATGSGPATASAGIRIAGTARIFEGGELKKTDSPLDVAIAGEGFLELAMPDGTRAFARGGTLKVNVDGYLSNHGGVPLKPGIVVPENAEALVISATGRVQARMPGHGMPADLGQLEVVRFNNPRGLSAEGANVYRITEASGEPLGGRPGEDGTGTVAQGFLEGSNVKLVEEMVDLMVAQRAYEASVKVVQATDDMLGLINGLRK
jgi:flagellar basal-body rod protein FlgG